MLRSRFFNTTSFRLAFAYLAMSSVAALSVGAFIYLSVRHQILSDFDERITEESHALKRAFAESGRDRLVEIIRARRSSGGSLEYGLENRNGEPLAGELHAPSVAKLPESGAWTELAEDDPDEELEEEPEIIRALVSRLSDGSILIVGDERHRSDEVLGSILWAFAFAIAGTVTVGIAGGLWLSAQFVKRVEGMRAIAREIMAGDFSRRIPLAPIDDGLSALARTFNQLLERIEMLLLANRNVAANIAHDLRKPLASVLKRLETRGDHVSSGADRRAIAASASELEGLLETFDALLRISEIEASARRAGFRQIDLAEIARDVVEAFQPSAEDERKEIVARLDAALPLSGDRELLAHMIANLLDNAVRHTLCGARIEVTGETTPFGVSLQIADNGPGVAEHELRAIFQPFYRAEGARKLRGTGLGLNLVLAIAELHGLNCSAHDNRPGLRVVVQTARSAD